MSTTDVDRLFVVIQRTLDSEAVCESDGATLLALGEAARRALATGDVAGSHSHIRQVARFARALAEEGLAVVRAAQWILDAQDSDASASSTAASGLRTRPASQAASSARASSTAAMADRRAS